MGLMQVMPDTWAELRLRYGLGNDPYDPPRQHSCWLGVSARAARPIRFAGFLGSVQCGTCSLRRASRWSLPTETQTYLAKLVPAIGSDTATSRLLANLRSSAATLFVVLSDSSKTATSAQPGRLPNRASIAISAHDVSAVAPAATGLFVARSDAGGRQ